MELTGNVPGDFPFTAGLFLKEGEDPTRMFAGEGVLKEPTGDFIYVFRDAC